LSGLINNIEIAIFAKEVAPGQAIIPLLHYSKNTEITGITNPLFTSIGRGTLYVFFIKIKER